MDKLLENKGIFEEVKAGRALDLGCGVGKDALALAQRGFTVDALDIKPENISRLKQSAAGAAVNAMSGSIEDFQIEGSQYSIIIANNSLPFIGTKEKTREIITRIAAGLAPGGFACITLFGPKDAWYGKPGMSFFTQEEGQEMLISLGLKPYFISTEEGYGKTMKGDIKYWHIHKYIYRK